MSVSPINPERLKALRAEYDKADLILREVTEFVDEAGIPAINELRYAGHHLLDAMLPANRSVIPDDELTSAINHCRRAIYEASEAGILAAFDRVQQFKSEFQDLPITPVVEDWTRILATCDEVKDQIFAARARGEDRHEEHLALRQAFGSLKAYCRRLDHAREELNKHREEAQAQRLSEQREGRRFIMTVLLTVLGIAASIVLGLLAL